MHTDREEAPYRPSGKGCSARGSCLGSKLPVLVLALPPQPADSRSMLFLSRTVRCCLTFWDMLRYKNSRRDGYGETIRSNCR